MLQNGCGGPFLIEIVKKVGESGVIWLKMS
jgi:hypothetical protein